MHAVFLRVWRPILGMLAVAVVFGGVAVAARNGDPPAIVSDPGEETSPMEPGPTAVPSARATPGPSTVASVTAAAAGPPPSPTAAGVLVASPPTSTVRTSAPTIAAPPPTSTPAQSVPVTDIPRFTDVAVLAMAADAVLPSGKTFRECVELPPSHEKWPIPVHLYYEGNGRWLVETHVSEVQVRFTEATGVFQPLNFVPVNPACR